VGGFDELSMTEPFDGDHSQEIIPPSHLIHLKLVRRLHSVRPRQFLHLE
jgi:hypothetical protein